MAQEPSSKNSHDWELYRALREQWTHEDNLINHRLQWLILSEGLLFTAYGTVSAAKLHWLIFSFPLFGIVIAAIIGVSIFSAIAATEETNRLYQESGLNKQFNISPSHGIGKRAKWATQALPFIFGALWLLALAESFVSWLRGFL